MKILGRLSIMVNYVKVEEYKTLGNEEWSSTTSHNTASLRTPTNVIDIALH